jgi:hypothetical protein
VEWEHKEGAWKQRRSKEEAKNTSNLSDILKLFFLFTDIQLEFSKITAIMPPEKTRPGFVSSSALNFPAPRGIPWLAATASTRDDDILIYLVMEQL